jgi:drug/metabolite transporter (DMT)-like permease
MGRPKLIVVLLIAGFSSFIGILLFSKYALSLDEQRRLFQGLRFAIGTACVLGTTAAFAAARRKALVGAATAGLAAALWIALCTLVVLEWHRHPERPLSSYVLVVGLLALAVAPLAAAPLAVAWNRHR